ncbi:MAG: transglutaminase-like domain-containing protein [Patescibacteria group bacterium]
MDKKKLQKIYTQYSTYTDPGLYGTKLKKTLPKDPQEIGALIRTAFVHRYHLESSRKGSPVAPHYGDMTRIPWYRQPEDDIYITAVALLAELYRRDKKGFHTKRKEEDKLILTCRYVAVLTASLFKIMGIPARVRSGFAGYYFKGRSVDHWTVEYWHKEQSRWAMADIDATLEEHLHFDPYDVPLGTFDYAANAWLEVRSGKAAPEYFWNAAGHEGLEVISWELFYDFHCIMNNEIIYVHVPEFIYGKFDQLTEDDLKEIDDLARLMQKPDENYEKLQKLWEEEQKYRLLKGGLL